MSVRRAGAAFTGALALTLAVAMVLLACDAPERAQPERPPAVSAETWGTLIEREEMLHRLRPRLGRLARSV